MFWRRIQRMVCDNFCKLLQRQTYTLLSSRNGMLLCFVAILITFVSVVQFGEVALEWSVLRYQKTLFPYVDNILHRSYQDRLCLPMPIDVVYTWVNGTDPRLLMQLTRLKAEMESQLNDSLLYDKMSSNGSFLPVRKGNSALNGCPYDNCVALNTLILKVHSVVMVSELKNVDPVFEQATSVYNVSLKSNGKSRTQNTRLIVVRFSDENTLQAAIDRSFNINGEKVVSQRAYLTSQSINLGLRMRAMALVGAVKRITDNGMAFKRFLRDHFSTKLKSLDFYEKEMVALLTFKDDQSYQEAIELKNGDLKFQGISLIFEPVLMVWEPFSSADVEREDNHFSASRFADNQELRYSLRSVERFAPWVRQIFIVTNGQIPNWLNLNNPRIKIIPHSEIFSNLSHLPTFSSPAIESHLHKIPGLSNKFIYLNDDVMFGKEVWPDDFYTHAKGQKVFLSWPVPNCNEGCPATWINDKYCDKACNVSECDWDGGDCLNEKKKSSPQWQSVLASMKKTKPQTFCNPGCADSWIGDRYCDGACNHPDCGFDAGDCGITQFHELHSEILHEDNNVFHLPSGLKAMYFNLSMIYGNGKITEGEQDGSSILRSVTIAQKFKSMIITFHPNETMTSVQMRVTGNKNIYANISELTELRINFTINTMPIENDGMQGNINVDSYSNKDNVTTSQTKIPITFYPIKIHHNASDRFNYWNSVDARWSPPTWPTRNAIEYCVPEIPHDLKVPSNLLKGLQNLEEEFKAGDITMKGLNRRKALLIKENLGLSCADAPPTTTRNEMMSYMKAMTKSNERTTSRSKDIKAPLFSTRHLNEFDEAGIENKGFLPWEKQDVFKHLQDRKLLKERYKTTSFHQRNLLDAFSGSLLHVNRLYNRAFGYKARKVPSHMPHMIDVNIMYELQAQFSTQFDATSSHKIRSQYDMQFALSYFYYVIDQTKQFNMSTVFLEADVDTSGTLSDRELRTLMTKFHDIPLKSENVKSFLEQLRNCSNSTNDIRETSERQYGYNIPTVTMSLLEDCEAITKHFQDTKKKENKFKHEIVGEDDVAFKMIKNNVSHVMRQLDGIRKHKKKFICLNDNIDHDHVNASIVKEMLVDFYESLFPIPSQFELPSGVKNQFLYVDELNSWKNEEKQVNFISDIILMLLLIVLMTYVCRSPVFYLLRRLASLIKRRFYKTKLRTRTSTKLLTV